MRNVSPIKKIQKAILVLTLATYSMLLTTIPASAGPAGSTYELKEYGFGAGGTNGTGTSGSTYSLYGSSGQIEGGQQAGSTYNFGGGLEYMVQANVPAAPTVTNPGSAYYNKLHVVIDNGSNPTDTVFLIAISPDAFGSTTNYIASDNTVTGSISSAAWQSYSTWGSSSGFDVIGLTPGTTYTFKVAARQGTFTQSPYSSTAAVATVSPTLTFSLSPSSISSWTLTPGSVSTSPTSATVTLSTNGLNGATVYVYDSKTGLQSTAASHTISSVSNDLTAISEGYGARGTTVTQSSGGPMEKVSPYNGSGNNVGILDSAKRAIFDSTGAPVTTGQATFELQAKPSTTAPPGSDYADTITVISSASF